MTPAVESGALQGAGEPERQEYRELDGGGERDTVPRLSSQRFSASQRIFVNAAITVNLSRHERWPGGHCEGSARNLILEFFVSPTGMRYDVRQREGTDDARGQRLPRHRPDSMDAELAGTDRAQRLSGKQASTAAVPPQYFCGASGHLATSSCYGKPFKAIIEAIGQSGVPPTMIGILLLNAQPFGLRLTGALDGRNGGRDVGGGQRGGPPLLRAAHRAAERYGVPHPREVVQDGQGDHRSTGRYRRPRSRCYEEGKGR